MKKSMTLGRRNNRTRSRILILHWICEFSLSRSYGGKSFGGLGNSCFVADGTAQVGDLVAIQSAPPSLFYLGWLLNIVPSNDGFCTKYLIESIEDGSQCWWSNIGVIFMNRETVQRNPQWRWTDKQHEFNDRWKRVCYKMRDAYLYLPVAPIFGENESVTLQLRVRFNLDDTRPSKMFLNWKKVTIAKMLEFYDDAVREIKASSKVAS